MGKNLGFRECLQAEKQEKENNQKTRKREKSIRPRTGKK